MSGLTPQELDRLALPVPVRVRFRQLASKARLSFREAEILALALRGHSNAEIGTRLSVSPHTVKAHLRNIHEKTGAHNQRALAWLALAGPLPTEEG